MKKESLKSSISNILKKTYLYHNVYHPYVASQVEASVRRRHSLLLREGATLLYEFIRCCTDMQIPYWLEFGTLLGAYRDGAFIQNDTDLDVGAYLQDARRLNQALTQAGFRLVREFHVVGENGLEQTYEYHELTIDVMYFYEQEGYVWCNGVVLPKITHKLLTAQVTAHWFHPFTLSTMSFLDMQVSIPANTEAHLMEIFGEGYRVYDPNFSGDLNKVYYPRNEKKAIGFYYE